ncbi:VCBS domain-containing protein [Roseibium sp.]|uniref:VCBS domain-containing protein n=1 Tax=Roseibium sp. TaxID=1936156 RepID=UPI00391AFBCB
MACTAADPTGTTPPPGGSIRRRSDGTTPPTGGTQRRRSTGTTPPPGGTHTPPTPTGTTPPPGGTHTPPTPTGTTPPPGGMHTPPTPTGTTPPPGGTHTPPTPTGTTPPPGGTHTPPTPTGTTPPPGGTHTPPTPTGTTPPSGGTHTPSSATGGTPGSGGGTTPTTTTAAVIGGVDTGSVTEWTAGQNMSPDYAQPGMATLSKATLDASGHLSITDPDAGEASFDTHGLGFTYHGTYGDLLLRANGEWFYHADAGSNRFVGGAATTRGTTIDRLGEGQSLTDTITVYSKDGTAHDIVVTIHGSNDRPYCSSEVQLAGGTEDVAQTLTLQQLLANTVDVDANDAGKLAIAGLKVDHGSVRDNQDGTFTFTPEKDYNGQVHFTYDVKDAHGGLTHTGATTTLAAVDDAAVITGIGDTLKEDRNLQGAGSGAEVHATGRFHVIDPDGAVQSHFVPHDIGGLLTGSFGGTLQIDENGGYFYSLYNVQVDHLKDGESVQDRFTIQSVDGTTHEVVFTIQGTSDAPVLYRNYQFAFEGTQLVQGKISAGDADKGDAQHLTYSTSGTVAGFSLHSDGSYTFDPANAAYDHLGRGDVQRLHIPITVTDPDGLTTNGELEIKLEGTNDAPKVSGAVDLGVTREDTAITFSKVALLANATDVDDYDRLHVTGVAVDANYGTITDNGDGTYTFTPATNYSGTDLPLTFTVQDRAGATTTGTATLDVTAVNDPAMIGGVDTGNVTEDKGVTGGNLTTSGTLTISDPDAGEAAFQPLTGGAGAGTYGTLTLDAQGHWTYTADNSQSAIQGLKTGESLTDTITVTAVDGTTHDVVISIAGTDDAAVISGQTVGDITEDAHSLNSVWETVSGKLTVVDPDRGQSSFTSVSKISDPFTTIGNGLWISSDGHWEYQVTDRGQLQHLAEGETVDVIYEVATADGTKQRITITVHGTNDAPTASFGGYAPIIDSSGPLSTDEDKAITVPVSGLLTWFSDTDTRDVLGVENLRADHGKITMSPDGQSFVFTPEVNYNGNVFFDFVVVDHHGGRTPGGVTMPVHAVADAAVIGGVDTGSVTEDVAPGPHTILNTISASGDLTISDPDAGESVFVAQGAVKGAYGTFSVNAAGHWTYDANNNQSAIQGLSQNAAPLTETFTVTSRDGTQHDVTISIHGTNDAPVLSAATASATEDGRTVTGQMSATDIDQGDTQHFSIGNPVAGFQMDAHGAWSFDPTDAAYQHLASGQTQQVTIPVTVTDKAGATDTQNLVITVTGTDDATVFGGVQTGNAHEDGNDVHVVGHHYLHDATDWQQITVTDPDGPVSQLTVEHGGQSVIWDMHSDLDIATPYGKFQLVHADGSGMLAKGYYWNYIGDNNNTAVQALKAGETLPPEQLTLVSPDGVRFPLTVTVHGAEDGIRIDTHGTLDHVSEHGPTAPASVGGQLQAHDPDAHDNVSWQPTPTGGVAGRMGTFTVDASGHWEYHVDPAKAAMLGQGMQMFEHFTITATSTDGSQASQRISVEVRGTDQAPDLSASTASATEDGHSISGHMSATDVDVADQKHFTAPSIAGFTLNGDGSWSFDPADAAYQHLADGATQQLTIPVTVTDKAGLSDTKNLVITVTGTNDAAHITGPDSATVVEDRNLSGGFLTAGGTLQVTDTDSGQDSFTPVASQQGTGGYGSFSIDTHGHWSYTADNSQHAIQQLGHGQSLTDTCVVTSSDGTRHTLNVTIDGTDEAPVVKPSVTAVQGMGTQHLAGTLASGGLGGWAIDNGHGGAVQSLHGQYGTLTINPQTGHFEYHYQQNSGVIKHGGSSISSGQHVDSFHVTQQGTAAGDVDVQVQVSVQSVHGASGHHVDHTVLQGITFTPVTPVQHDTSDNVDAVDVNLDPSNAAPISDPSSSAQDVDSASLDLDHIGTGADGAETVEAPTLSPDSNTESENGPLDHYFDAIGQGHDAGPSPMAPVAHLSSYLDAAGAAPDMAAPAPDFHDPSTLDGDFLSGDVEDQSREAAEQQQDHDVPQDIPESVLPDPNDDTSQYG